MRTPLLTVLALFAVLPLSTATAQSHVPDAGPALSEPGQAIFGTVQEAIRVLEADSTTDWSQVDVERLRRHLIDMHNVALHVEVTDRAAIENGSELVVRPTTEAAHASLENVLDAHPMMLKHEAGWTMEVTKQDGDFRLRTTDPDGDDAAKIRALGYIELLAKGQHHQRHHWMMVRGQSPHGH